MTNWNTENSGFACDNAAGTLVDLSAYVSSAGPEGGQELLDDTGLGMSQRSVEPGLGTATRIPVTLFKNSTTYAIFGPLVNGTSVQKTVEVKHFTGKYQYGEAWPETVTLPVNAAALQVITCTFVAQSGLTSTSITQVA